jgi:hypothetical protein
MLANFTIMAEAEGRGSREIRRRVRRIRGFRRTPRIPEGAMEISTLCGLIMD